jgi:hypothetical protein
VNCAPKGRSNAIFALLPTVHYYSSTATATAAGHGIVLGRQMDLGNAHVLKTPVE